MRRLRVVRGSVLAGAVLIGLVALSANLATQGQVHTVTALVGGTLVDGNGVPRSGTASC